MGLNAFYGLVLGAPLGAIGGIIGGLYTAFLLGMLGAVTGILLGGFNGIVLDIVAVVFFYSRDTQTRYKFVALIVALAITFLSSFFWFSAIMTYYSATGSVELWAVLIPTTIATIAAGYASQRIARWYSDTASPQ